MGELVMIDELEWVYGGQGSLDVYGGIAGECRSVTRVAGVAYVCLCGVYVWSVWLGCMRMRLDVDAWLLVGRWIGVWLLAVVDVGLGTGGGDVHMSGRK